jgi:Response regulator containing CheY-like receiver, AAA-type ATPase, and DNA-binding domains
MEMLVVLNEGGLITEKDIPDKYLKKSNNIVHSESLLQGRTENLNIGEKNITRFDEEPFQINLKEKMESAEREIVEKAMKISGGVKEKAAKMLGLNRTTLIEKLKRYEKNKKIKIKSFLYILLSYFPFLRKVFLFSAQTLKLPQSLQKLNGCTKKL